MANHNQVNLIGYLCDDPVVMSEGTEDESIILRLKTARREREGLSSDVFQKIIIYYDQPDIETEEETEETRVKKVILKETSLMKKLKGLRKYDLVEIKGVFMLLSIDKYSECPECAEDNVKENGAYPVVYPQFMLKLQDYREVAKYDINLPDALLRQKFGEISNLVTIIGTVVSEPEKLRVKGANCCRYKIVIDRKYFVPTQAEIHEDFPYIYSYGKQADFDSKYLQIGAEIFVEGFLRVREVKMDIQCRFCELTYAYEDVAAEIVPYSVEYLNGHLTDADIARMEEEAAEKALQGLL